MADRQAIGTNGRKKRLAGRDHHALIRQNHLVVDGWIVLRFSFDDVRDKPGIHRKTTAKHLRKLRDKGLLIPIIAKPKAKDIVVRTVRYQVVLADFQGFRV